MSTEPTPDPLGGPQPMTPEELAGLGGKKLAAGDPEVVAKAEAEWDGVHFFSGLRLVPMMVGGVIVFGAFVSLNPFVTSGATRSARLRWQLQRAELQQDVAASQPSVAKAPAAVPPTTPADLSAQ